MPTGQTGICHSISLENQLIERSENERNYLIIPLLIAIISKVQICATKFIRDQKIKLSRRSQQCLVLLRCTLKQVHIDLEFSLIHRVV
jgi:hypothetical protein